MKITAIGLIVLSILYSSRIYLKTIEAQLEWLIDWEKVLRSWREWMECYSYSVDELIQKTTNDNLTKELKISKKLSGKSINVILSEIENEQIISDKDKQIIIDVLSRIGGSLIENEIEGLTSAITRLSAVVAEFGSKVKERRALALKLIPLLCGALVVILW